MSMPRERHPGTTYLLTRRCERQLFRLRPDPRMNAAFAVAIADAAERTGVEVTGLCILSDHWHAVVFDPMGRVSEFVRDVHATVARFGNAIHGSRAVKFWDGQQTDLLELGDADAIVNATAYVLANAVRAKLVERPEEWPGLHTDAAAIGTWRGPVFERPKGFFRADGRVSEIVELCTYVPPMCERAYGVDGFRERVQAAVDAHVATARRAVEARGRGVLGVEAILRQSVWDSASTPDGRTAGAKAKARHTVAASDRARLHELIERVKAFRKLHREALIAFAQGLRSTLFPPGTWHAWRFYGVRRAVGVQLAAA